MDPKEIRENAIRDTKCNIILDAARQVFAQNGYHDTRLEDIAAAAGFSKASLYNYYADKETIFLNLAVREYGAIIGAIRASLSSEYSFDQNVSSALKVIFGHFGEHFAFLLSIINMPNMVRLHEDISRHEELMGKFKCGMGEIFEIFAEIIGWARLKKQVTSTLTDATLASYIASLVRGAIFEWKMNGKMGDIDVAVHDIVQFSLHGVNAQ